MCFLYAFCFGPYLFLNTLLHIFLNQNSYLCLLLIVCTSFISFFKSFSFLPSSFKPSMYNKWLILLSVPCNWHPQTVLFSSFAYAMSAMQKRNGERDSPWNIPLRIWIGCDCITSCGPFLHRKFTKSDNFTVHCYQCYWLFHPAMWNAIKCFLVINPGCT